MNQAKQNAHVWLKGNVSDQSDAPGREVPWRYRVIPSLPWYDLQKFKRGELCANMPDWSARY